MEERGGSYHVTDEQIRRWRDLPTLEKLRWLHEANEFLRLAMTDESKRIMECFRKGTQISRVSSEADDRG